MSNSSLNAKKVTLSGDGYTLKLDSDVSEPTSKNVSLTLKNSTATYTSSTTAGYTLAEDGQSISYSKATSGKTMATIKGADWLSGGSNNDSINGGTGNDVIYVNKGADTLLGGAGNDTFIYKPGEGNDTIFDYKSGDMLQILKSNGSEVGTFSSSSSQNSNLTLGISGGGSVIFKGVSKSHSFNINGDTYKISGSKLTQK